MVGCSVPFCSNRTDQGFKTFRLPTDPQRRQEWIRFAGRHNWVPNAGASFCQVHFEESAFESHRADGLKKLKPNAVPTIHSVSGQFKEKRRKKKVKPRIEFTFGENDNESFVLAEKVPAEAKKTDTIQISEVYCNELDDTHKKPGKRKRLKTIHVTEIVSNGLSLPICGEQAEPIKLCSPFSNSENQAVKVNVNKAKRGRPAKKRIKDKEMEYKRNNSVEYVENQSFGSINEVVDQTINCSDTPVPVEENLPLECFVCSKAINQGISLSIPTEASCVPLVQRLEIIANVEGLLSVQEVVCSRCASLLNYVDRTEAELDLLKSAISACARGRTVHSKFRKDPEYVFNVQLLDRFGSLNEGNHNILSLDELFLIQEESKEMAGMVLEDRSEEEQSQIVENEDSILDYNRNSVAGEVLELDVDNSPSSLIGEPNESPLDGSSQLNLESALKESSSTDIIVNPNVPASHALPSTSFSKKSSNPTTSSHNRSNTHICKICSFKTQHDSVMIWHLRMHMKSGRWCDFCNVPIPTQESHFLTMKKKTDSGRIRRKPIGKSTLPVILPASAKESCYPFKPISLPLIPIEKEKVSAPVLVISKESDSSQEAVGIPTAIVELPKNLESLESVIADPGMIESRNVPTRTDKPQVGDEKVQGEINSQLVETLAMEEFDRVVDSGSERLQTTNSETLREEVSVTISECDILVAGSVGQDFSTLPEQCINNACAPENVGGFAKDQVSKSGVFCEEHSFLDTLSSQQEGKFPEMLPEICSEENEQGMISIANVGSEGNLTNKDVSFARSDGLGESVLAIAYENSVAALMCQSDDSEGILSYQ